MFVTILAHFCSSLYRRLDPVATAPGSVFVDQRCQTFCLRGFGGHVFSRSEMQRRTNTEPSAVAPGAWLAQVNIPCTTQFKRLLIVKVERLGRDPVASTTPSGLPAWGPRSAPGSVFVDPRCQALWQGFALIILNVYNRINYVTLSP